MNPESSTVRVQAASVFSRLYPGVALLQPESISVQPCFRRGHLSSTYSAIYQNSSQAQALLSRKRADSGVEQQVLEDESRGSKP